MQSILQEPLFTSTIKIETLGQEMQLCDEGVAYERRYFEHVFILVQRKLRSAFRAMFRPIMGIQQSQAFT